MNEALESKTEKGYKMNGTIDANIQQIKDCLKEYNTWNQTHVVNICTGKDNIIPWGIDCYIMGSIFIIFFIFFTYNIYRKGL